MNEDYYKDEPINSDNFVDNNTTIADTITTTSTYDGSMVLKVVPDDYYNNLSSYCSSTISSSGIFSLEDYVKEIIKSDKNLTSKIIEECLGDRKFDEDYYDVVLNFLRTYLEKIMNSPEDILLREVRGLRKENEDLKMRLQALEDKLG